MTILRAAALVHCGRKLNNNLNIVFFSVNLSLNVYFLDVTSHQRQFRMASSRMQFRHVKKLVKP